MSVEDWGISETTRFREDVLHYQPSEAMLRQWRENIQRDPMIGKPADDGTGIGEYDYVVGDLLIRYIIVPQQRHVLLMTIRRREDVASNTKQRAGRLWRILLEVLQLWNGLKWW